jgi:hypothetical protein
MTRADINTDRQTDKIDRAHKTERVRATVKLAEQKRNGNNTTKVESKLLLVEARLKVYLVLRALCAAADNDTDRYR